MRPLSVYSAFREQEDRRSALSQVGRRMDPESSPWRRRDGTYVAVGSNCRQPEEEEPERESAAGGEWADAEYSTRAEELNRHLAVHIDSDNRRSRRKLSENQKWKVVTVAAIAVLALVCAAVGLVDFLIPNMAAS